MSDPEASPAHVHGRRTPRVRGRSDAHTLRRRLPVVVVLTAALVGAVIVDRDRDDAAAATGRDAAVAAEGRPAALMPATVPSGAGSATWYCAAGTAEEGGMADHTVTMFNPSTDDREATVTVFAGSVAGATAAAMPAPVVEQVELRAGRRVDLRLGDLVASPLAAALVEVDGGGVAVEHRVVGEHGADAAPCSTFAAPTWHLAWGATTRDARNTVVLFNPFPSSATVDAVFTTDDGRREPVRFQGFPVPAGSVVGVDLGDDVTRSEHVSATFEARSGRVVVEQLQDFDGSLGMEGLSLTLGAPEAGETWVFTDGEASAPGPTTPAPGADEETSDEDADADADAPDEAEADADDADTEGTEDADDEALTTTERIVVYNPGAERAEVEVSAIPRTDEPAPAPADAPAPAPAPQPFRLSIGPGRYKVVDYGDEDRIEAGVAHATVVRSTNGEPVVSQRVTVDTGPAPEPARESRDEDLQTRPGEITVATGSRLAAPRWAFASATPGDPDGDADTVAFVVFNPDPEDAVSVRLDLESETVDLLSPFTVPPGASVTMELDADESAATEAAVIVADGPVIAERVVRLADGRRSALGPGVPEAGDAVTLDRLADEGLLGGVLSG